jgi:hypothetical protein
LIVGPSAYANYTNAKVRSGVRVPIATGSFNTGVGSGANNVSSPHALIETQYTYLDVGTNIDCSASPSGEDGRYRISLSAERSWIFVDSQANGTKAGESIRGEASGNPETPSVRQFKIDFTVELKDGQTIENAAVVTDPLNGHVYRISITMNVVK